MTKMKSVLGAAALLSSFVAAGSDDDILLSDGFENLDLCSIVPTPGYTRAYPQDTYATIIAPFGQPGGQSYVGLSIGEYAALQIDVPASPRVHRLLWDLAPNSPSAVRIAIAECPGFPDRNNVLPKPACYYQGSGSNGGMTLASDASSFSTICNLQPGRTYWMNFAFVDANGSAACGGFRCTMLITAQ